MKSKVTVINNFMNTKNKKKNTEHKHTELMTLYENTNEQIKYQKSLAWKTTLMFISFVWLMIKEVLNLLFDKITNISQLFTLFLCYLALISVVIFLLGKICYSSFEELKKRRKELLFKRYKKFKDKEIYKEKRKKYNNYKKFLSKEEHQYRILLWIIWIALIFFLLIAFLSKIPNTEILFLPSKGFIIFIDN